MSCLIRDEPAAFELCQRDISEPAFTDDPVRAMLKQALRAGRSVPALRLWGLIEDKLIHVFTQLWTEILEWPAPDIDALLGKYLPPLAEQLNNLLSGR